MNNYTVILFYKYVKISEPEKIRLEQLSVCNRFGFKGRVIIAKEGINATLEGTTENIEKYCEDLLASDLFKNTHIKKSVGNGNSFQKLIIKVRPEIVTAKLPVDVDPNEVTGKRLAPETLYKWIESGEDFEIIDMRNEYEFKSGHFAPQEGQKFGSHFSGMKNFRDLHEVPEKQAHLKEKKVITVCTGGVRCEKASGHLINNGWKDVYQLDGGIVTYMKKYPGHAFEGTLYTFDNRITMDFDDPATHKVVGKCEKCLKPSENYINCAFGDCHVHFICCKGCLGEAGEGFCSRNCEESYQKNNQKTLI